ncbi:MAG: ATP-binding protein [Phormidesmis sp.]
MSSSAPQAILLVDDNPHDRLLVKRQLSQEFNNLTLYEVVDQTGLAQAIATIDFDFVITDYQLGWSTGVDVMKHIRAKKPYCPVIMFTSTCTQEIAIEAMKSGLNDYVVKSPQHFIRLPQAIRSSWHQCQTQLEAAQLELRLQVLLNQLEFGIFRAATDGKLLDVNPALLKMLAVDTIEAAQVVLQPQLAALCPVAAMALAAQEVTLQKISRSGREVWLQITATANDLNGEVIIDGVIQDVSERKQAEQAVSHLNQTLEDRIVQRTEQLKTTNRELELFAYSVSHDLRSPLRQIDGFVHLLRDHLNLAHIDETTQHYFETISGLIGQAGNMIDALLNFSHTGRVNMTWEAVDMSQQVEQVRRQVEASYPHRTVEWQIDPLPTVWCDRILMQTVWQNLLDNALKFTEPQASPKIVIGVKLPSPGKNGRKEHGQAEIVFFISDNGVGFAPQRAEKIFGIFQQAHSKKDFGGTGIGLANVQHIILRHQGRVWAQSADDQGAIFYFSLPQSPDARHSSSQGDRALSR